MTAKHPTCDPADVDLLDATDGRWRLSGGFLGASR